VSEVIERSPAALSLRLSAVHRPVDWLNGSLVHFSGHRRPSRDRRSNSERLRLRQRGQWSGCAQMGWATRLTDCLALHHAAPCSVIGGGHDRRRRESRDCSGGGRDGVGGDRQKKKKGKRSSRPLEQTATRSLLHSDSQRRQCCTDTAPALRQRQQQQQQQRRPAVPLRWPSASGSRSVVAMRLTRRPLTATLIETSETRATRGRQRPARRRGPKEQPQPSPLQPCRDEWQGQLSRSRRPPPQRVTPPPPPISRRHRPAPSPRARSAPARTSARSARTAWAKAGCRVRFPAATRSAPTV